MSLIENQMIAVAEALVEVKQAVDGAVCEALTLRAHIDYEAGVADAFGAIKRAKGSIAAYLRSLADGIEAEAA